LIGPDLKPTLQPDRALAADIALESGCFFIEVEMTTQGVGGALSATQPLEAWRACLLHWRVRIAAADPTESDPTVHEYLAQIHLDDWAVNKSVDFDAQPVKTFYARAGSLAYGGLIENHLDHPEGELIGTCTVPRTSAILPHCPRLELSPADRGCTDIRNRLAASEFTPYV
jgi:hypothetical protein